MDLIGQCSIALGPENGPSVVANLSLPWGLLNLVNKIVQDKVKLENEGLDFLRRQIEVQGFTYCLEPDNSFVISESDSPTSWPGSF